MDMKFRDRYAVSDSSSREVDGHFEVRKVDIDQDPLADLYKRKEHKYHYRNEEQGVFHPVFHQGLKLRNNGAADLFVDQDNGIRIDPTTQSVNVFANHYKAHIHHMTSWLTGSVNYHVGEHWKVKTKGHHIIEAGGSLIINVNGDIPLTVNGNVSAEINGNVDAKVKGHATMDVDRTLTLSAEHLSIQANSYQVPWMPHEHPQYARVGHSHPQYED